MATSSVAITLAPPPEILLVWLPIRCRSVADLSVETPNKSLDITGFKLRVLSVCKWPWS